MALNHGSGGASNTKTAAASIDTKQNFPTAIATMIADIASEIMRADEKELSASKAFSAETRAKLAALEPKMLQEVLIHLLKRMPKVKRIDLSDLDLYKLGEGVGEVFAAIPAVEELRICNNGLSKLTRRDFENAWIRLPENCTIHYGDNGLENVPPLPKDWREGALGEGFYRYTHPPLPSTTLMEQIAAAETAVHARAVFKVTRPNAGVTRRDEKIDAKSDARSVAASHAAKIVLQPDKGKPIAVTDQGLDRLLANRQQEIQADKWALVGAVTNKINFLELKNIIKARLKNIFNKFNVVDKQTLEFLNQLSPEQLKQTLMEACQQLPPSVVSIFFDGINLAQLLESDLREVMATLPKTVENASLENTNIKTLPANLMPAHVKTVWHAGQSLNLTTVTVNSAGRDEKFDRKDEPVAIGSATATKASEAPATNQFDQKAAERTVVQQHPLVAEVLKGFLIDESGLPADRSAIGFAPALVKKLNALPATELQTVLIQALQQREAYLQNASFDRQAGLIRQGLIRYSVHFDKTKIADKQSVIIVCNSNTDRQQAWIWLRNSRLSIWDLRNQDQDGQYYIVGNFEIEHAGTRSISFAGIDLSKMGVAGIQAVFNAVQCDKVFGHHLYCDLSHTNLSKLTATELADVFKMVPGIRPRQSTYGEISGGLTHLYLDGNNLSSYGENLTIPLAALASFVNLRFVRLNANNLGDLTPAQLIACVKVFSTGVQITLASNQLCKLGPAGFKQLMQAWPDRTSVYIPNNDLHKIGVMGMYEGFKALPHHQIKEFYGEMSMDLRGNQLQRFGAQNIYHLAKVIPASKNWNGTEVALDRDVFDSMHYGDDVVRVDRVSLSMYKGMWESGPARGSVADAENPPELIPASAVTHGKRCS